jgi:hypothetical protein
MYEFKWRSQQTRRQRQTFRFVPFFIEIEHCICEFDGLQAKYALSQEQVQE